MTNAEAGVLLDALHAAFPRTTISADTAQLYARFLVDLDLQSAAQAVAMWIATAKFFPTVGELRGLATSDGGAPDPDRAFAEVMKVVGSTGVYRTPRFSHPAIAEAVDAITWREVCLSDHAPSLRAHFAKAYEAARLRSNSAAHRGLVNGIVADVRAKLAGKAPAQLAEGKKA